MLDQILALVQQYGQNTIVQNPDVPNEHNDAAMKLAGESILDGLKGAMQSGQLPQLMGLIAAGQSMMQNPVVKQIVFSFSEKLVSQAGINTAQAQGVAGDTVQQVLQGAIAKLSSGDAQSADLMAMAQSFLGAQGGSGLGSLVSALDKNHDGKVDMQDAVAGIVGNGALGALAGKLLSGK